MTWPIISLIFVKNWAFENCYVSGEEIDFAGIN